MKGNLGFPFNHPFLKLTATFTTEQISHNPQDKQAFTYGLSDAASPDKELQPPTFREADTFIAPQGPTFTMVQYIPTPDYRSLLPPLLACLPTAFVSPRPPPALLPLLSPISRQRVQHLAAIATSSADSWLPLLCWESEPAQRLVDLVSESNAFELHPASGEIDFGDVEKILYRQLDEETLQARMVVTDMRTRRHIPLVRRGSRRRWEWMASVGSQTVRE